MYEVLEKLILTPMGDGNVYTYLPLISTSIIQPRVPKKLTSTSPKTSKKSSKTS